MRAIFRCDATAGIGFGHLSRCMALAEAFRLSAVDSSFAGLFDPAAKDQIASAGLHRIDLADPVNMGAAAEREVLSGARNEQGGSFVIVDSYRADPTYLADLKSLGLATVLIDDFGALSNYPCDVVLNFTWGAQALGYPKGPVLLLGPEHFPARRQLVALRTRSIGRDRRGRIRNLLIAIGGSDPKRIAARLVRLLRERHAGTCLQVVAANESDLAIELADFAPGSRILPRQPDLSEQLFWADACITGGGLIKYEGTFMGVPAAAIAQNEGQAGETRVLTQAGLVFDLGLADGCTDEELGGALDRFISGEALREELAVRVRGAFPSDPSANAALSIMNAVGG
jgi:spore coat polysaccharide biosynthesis predicted glycosyltransferase SpsG